MLVIFISVFDKRLGIDTLTEVFKWENFAKKMYNFLFKIASDLDRPLLYEIVASPVSLAVESASNEKADGSDEQDQER